MKMPILCKRIFFIILLFFTVVATISATSPRYRYSYIDTPIALWADSLVVNDAKFDITLHNDLYAVYNLKYTVKSFEKTDSLFVEVVSDLGDLKIILDGHTLDVDSLYRTNVYIRSDYSYKDFGDYMFIGLLDGKSRKLEVSFKVRTNTQRGKYMYTYGTQFNLEYLDSAKYVGNIEVKAKSLIDSKNVSLYIADSIFALNSKPQIHFLKSIPQSPLKIEFAPQSIIPLIPQELLALIILIILIVGGIYLICKRIKINKNKKKYGFIICLSLFLPFVWFILYSIITFCINLIIGEYSIYYESPDIYMYIYYVLIYPITIMGLFIIFLLSDFIYRLIDKNRNI